MVFWLPVVWPEVVVGGLTVLPPVLGCTVDALERDGGALGLQSIRYDLTEWLDYTYPLDLLADIVEISFVSIWVIGGKEYS